MFFMLALWLGALFVVVGILWLLVRKLNRLEHSVRELALKQGVTQQPGNDAAFVRRFIVAYLIALFALTTLFGAMAALPIGKSAETTKQVPIPLEDR